MDGQTTKQKTPACYSTYPKVGVSYSKDSFVVNQSLVLRINIGAENRHFAKLQNVSSYDKTTHTAQIKSKN